MVEDVVVTLGGAAGDLVGDQGNSTPAFFPH